jgi:hypothetical protein
MRFGSLARISGPPVWRLTGGILARDMINGKLYNVAGDSHEVGVIWLGQPLNVCDVYEHAFYVDLFLRYTHRDAMSWRLQLTLHRLRWPMGPSQHFRLSASRKSPSRRFASGSSPRAVEGFGPPNAKRFLTQSRCTNGGLRLA